MKTDPDAPFVDRAELAALLGTDAALLDLTSEFSPELAVPAQHALHVRKGHTVVRQGCILPVVQGQTCTTAFLDPLPSAQDAVPAPLDVPQGSIRNALVLSGSISPLAFIYHVFPALLFLKNLAGPSVPIHLGQDVPTSLAPLVDDLAPMLSGGKPIIIARPADGTYEIEDCIFPTRTTQSFFPATFARRVILPFVLRREMLGTATPARLFLHGGQQKTLINDDQIVAWFVARGYKAIDTDSLPFAKQVALVAQASHVACVDGDTLALLAFAVQAQTVVVLGCAETMLDPMLAHLTEDYDATWIFIAGTPDANPHGVQIALEHLERIKSPVL